MPGFRGNHLESMSLERGLRFYHKQLKVNDLINGGRGIRTPGTVPRTAVFKTAGFNRSPIPPLSRIL